MMICMPNDVEDILNTLNRSGYEGFVVGGCVRDSIIGIHPKDWDIATNAKPQEIKKLFNNTIDVGIDYGTIRVINKDTQYEITTYRKDGKYKDKRRPSSVEFSDNIEDDLSRRDFTINAMAYNREIGLIDLYEGNEHIKQKKICCVGNANERISEDALRIIRGVRFASQLGFEIEQDTKNAMKLNSKYLEYISKERIREEFDKILLTKKPSYGLNLILEINALKYIIPELEHEIGFKQNRKYHDKDVFNHSLTVVDNVESNLVLRLAALLHDIGKPHVSKAEFSNISNNHKHNIIGAKIADKILNRLKYDKNTINLVKKLVIEHMSYLICETSKDIKKLINRMGIENIDLLLKLQRADILGKSKNYNFKAAYKLEEEINKILLCKEPLTLGDLDITGDDLIKLGIKEGKLIGEILNKLHERVLENPEENSKDILLQIAKDLKN